METSTYPAEGASPGSLDLTGHARLFVKQKHEMGELFGFETRNRYEITDEQGGSVAYAAEQQKGILGFLLRQFFGHWRRFDIHLFDTERRPVLIGRHPFRFLFQRLEIFDPAGRAIGAIQQRFSLLSKRFDVVDGRGMTVFETASPFWRIWTFPFLHQGRQLAVVAKQWSGLLSEAFTDKDNFLVQFDEAGLSNDERLLVLAASVFIDLQYFERKAGR